MKRLVEAYRTRLVCEGFAEASRNPLHFWRRLHDKTAFVINLKPTVNGIGVVYGCTSIAGFDKTFLCEDGVSDDDCKIRYYKQICSETDEVSIGESIQLLHEQYREIDKDALLKDAKEHKKEFINQIHTRLKPLGFRKKGYQWSKILNDKLILKFCADLPPFLDLFYFEVHILTQNPSYCMGCYNKRLEAPGTDVLDFRKYSESTRRFDWQLQADEFESYFERVLQEEILPLISNNPEELRNNPEIIRWCHCPMDRCDSCWLVSDS